MTKQSLDHLLSDIGACTVCAAYLPERVVLPHPSPSNQHWLTKNPWFEIETLPAVQRRIAQGLAGEPLRSQDRCGS